MKSPGEKEFNRVLERYLEASTEYHKGSSAIKACLFPL